MKQQMCHGIASSVVEEEMRDFFFLSRDRIELLESWKLFLLISGVRPVNFASPCVLKIAHK